MKVKKPWLNWNSLQTCMLPLFSYRQRRDRRRRISRRRNTHLRVKPACSAPKPLSACSSGRTAKRRVAPSRRLLIKVRKQPWSVSPSCQTQTHPHLRTSLAFRSRINMYMRWVVLQVHPINASSLKYTWKNVKWPSSLRNYTMGIIIQGAFKQHFPLWIVKYFKCHNLCMCKCSCW